MTNGVTRGCGWLGVLQAHRHTAGVGGRDGVPSTASGWNGESAPGEAHSPSL